MELGTIVEKDFIDGGGGIITENCNYREASRAVLLDQAGKVHLMNVTLHKYHKLPGGGIDTGESIEDALKREILEETGCNIEILYEVGAVTEYRPGDATWNGGSEGLKQTSYCYLAIQIGKAAKPNLEEGEILEGMIQEKADSIQAAIDLLAKDKPDNLEGKYIQKRDLLFLEAAKKLYESKQKTRL